MRATERGSDSQLQVKRTATFYGFFFLRASQILHTLLCHPSLHFPGSYRGRFSSLPTLPAFLKQLQGALGAWTQAEHWGYTKADVPWCARSNPEAHSFTEHATRQAPCWMLGDSREGDGVARPRLELLGSGGGSQWARANSERSEKHRGHGAGNAVSLN